MAKFLFIIIGSLVWQIAIASAGDLEKGINFFEQEDYVKARQLWQPLANKGDPRAQYNLALLLNKNIKNNERNGLQRQKANEYLIMSRSAGLVDGYFPSVLIASISTEGSRFAGGSGSAEGSGPTKGSISAEGSVSAKGSRIIVDPIVWLNQQQKNTYTLQLATGKSKKSMQIMLEKLYVRQELGQPENLYIHKVEKIEQQKMTIRYILVYGIFKTYQDAKAEVDRLPGSIQKSSPWIRQFGAIQSIVNN